ncbi:MAG: hypothetical protein DRI57_04570, partial [Deltaproteobacteria bacterium]
KRENENLFVRTEVFADVLNLFQKRNIFLFHWLNFSGIVHILLVTIFRRPRKDRAYSPISPGCPREHKPRFPFKFSGVPGPTPYLISDFSRLLARNQFRGRTAIPAE